MAKALGASQMFEALISLFEYIKLILRDTWKESNQ